MAVYRTTYKDPKAWEAFLGLLQHPTFIKHDAKGDHRFRVFEDGALEGVGLQEVQRRFARERAAHRDAPSRQARLALWDKGLRPAEPGILASGAESSSSSSASTPRTAPEEPLGPQAADQLLAGWHNYFLVVDEACLDSVRTGGNQVVKLVRRGPEGDEEQQGRRQDAENCWTYLPLAKYVRCCSHLRNHSTWPKRSLSKLPAISTTGTPLESVTVWVG
ncbi:uncharacterized protein PG986_004699 [Apiospora aurea]|uniref:Uncharacterized protein n=1 Tax=Apiospora aurea TaxID=335848 RepID=A0ABR1QP42_9PEZI